MSIESSAIVKGFTAGSAALVIIFVVFATRYLIKLASGKGAERLNYALHGSIAGATLYLTLFVEMQIEGWFLVIKNLLGYAFSYAYMIYWTSRRLYSYEGSSNKVWLFVFPPLGVMYFVFLCIAGNKNTEQPVDKLTVTPLSPKNSSRPTITNESDRIEPTL